MLSISRPYVAQTTKILSVEHSSLLTTAALSTAFHHNPTRRWSSSSSSTYPITGTREPTTPIIPPEALETAVSRNPHRHLDTVGRSNPRRRIKMIYATYVDYIAHFETGQNSSVLLWKDQLAYINDTALLLEKTAWTVEESNKAEKLLIFWSTRETIRSILLQMALYQRILELHDNAETLRQETTLLCQLIANWRMVITSDGIKAVEHLESVHLTPSGMLTAVLKTLHEHYGCFIRDIMLHMIAEASVALDGPPEFTNQVLQTSCDMWRNHRYCYPDVRLFNLVLLAWQGQGMTSIDQFYRITRTMDEFKIAPDKISYHLAIQMFGDLKTIEGAQQAERMLKQMVKNYVENTTYAQPDVFAFSMVAAAWANSGAEDAGPKTVVLYNEMEALRQKGTVFGKETYVPAVLNSIVESFANAADPPAAAAEAEKFLRDTGHTVTGVLYVSLIKLFCRSRDEKAIHRLLNEIEGKRIELNQQSYVTVFTALANSRLTKKAEVAMSVLKNIKASSHLMPDTAMYNAFLTVLASSAKNLRFNALRILDEMRNNHPECRPNKKTYTIVIKAFARAGDVDRAGDVLRLMYEDFVKTRDENVAPDLQAFNTVLSGYANSKSDDAAQEAESFLKDLLNMTEGAWAIKPDTYTISSVLQCYGNVPSSKAVEASGKARRLLKECRKWGVVPNRFCYNSAINAVASNRQPEMAEKLFREMLTEYKNGNADAKPDVVTLNILVKAWATSRNRTAVDRAEKLIEEFSTSLDIMPNITTYTSLILCYSLIQTPDAGQRAEALLEHMDKLYAAGTLKDPPSLTTLYTLRKVWYYSKDKSRDEGKARIEQEIARRFPNR